MRLSINQPAYLPWLGYFDRIARSDIHVELDDVQFEKNSVTNRNKIRTATGWSWITIPVRTRHRFGKLGIDAVEVDRTANWRRKHWDSLRFTYAKSPHFGDHASFFEDIYAQDLPLLVDFVRPITQYLLDALGIPTPVRRSSTLGVIGTKGDLVLNIAKEVGASCYISGPFGRDYLDAAAFEAAGIELLFHDYRHPEYTHAHDGFELGMSVIDLLFNHGPASLEILRDDRELVRQ